MISEQQKPVDSGFGAKSEPSEVMEGIDLSGKTAVVTGGYSGIGTETTRALVNAGCEVYIPARRTNVAVKELEGILSTENIIEMDLASPKSVQTFVDDFSSQINKLDILINNAGVMACPEIRTSEGWELQFAVNQIGHFVLTKGLLPLMEKAEGARLVALSSTGHKISGIRWDDIHFNTSDYDKWTAYGQSKTAGSLLAVEVDKRMKSSGISAFGVHPGGIMTPLQRHLETEEMVVLGWMNEDGQPSERVAKMFKSPTQGASTSLWAATSPQLDGIGGVYCENCDVAKRQDDSDKNARFIGVADWAVDSEEASRLWDETERMLS
jgi:NAD(P)-dependent dehydrogenase (short-subunit alcohol dehydrogenase family)